jgi:hypothetical protein
MSGWIDRGDPRRNKDVREIIKVSHESHVHLLDTMREWLTSDSAEGRVIWQFDNQEDTDTLVLVIGFTHPATAFAFKLRFM